MVLTSCRYVSATSMPFVRRISMTYILESNHYNALGLTPTASQADIKKAYYRLSQIYHPDKNQGSEESTKKFRDISTAYEVLGNEKLRKEYDMKTIYSHPSPQPNIYTRRKEDADDESERIYYEQRKKRKSEIYTGRTWYYDFDTWNKSHFPEGDKRRRQDRDRRKKWNQDIDDFMNDGYEKREVRYDKLLYSFGGGILIFAICSHIISNRKGERDRVDVIKAKTDSNDE